MKRFLKSLSIVLAILLAMTLSIAVFAANEEGGNEDASSIVESNSDATVSDGSSVADTSDSSEASKATSESSKTSANESSKATVSNTSNTTSKESGNKEEKDSFWTDFPWARVITLVVILVLVLVAFILAKTKTKLGLKIAKFFKEYWSEIKKVSWCSPKDTLKATGIVLVFIIVAAVAVGVLDFGFTKLVELLATAFN